MWKAFINCEGLCPHENAKLETHSRAGPRGSPADAPACPTHPVLLLTALVTAVVKGAQVPFSGCRAPSTVMPPSHVEPIPSGPQSEPVGWTRSGLSGFQSSCTPWRPPSLTRCLLCKKAGAVLIKVERARPQAGFSHLYVRVSALATCETGRPWGGGGGYLSRKPGLKRAATTDRISCQPSWETGGSAVCGRASYSQLSQGEQQGPSAGRPVGPQSLSTVDVSASPPASRSASALRPLAGMP